MIRKQKRFSQVADGYVANPLFIVHNLIDLAMHLLVSPPRLSETEPKWFVFEITAMRSVGENVALQK